jgi:hypothetical protein
MTRYEIILKEEKSFLLLMSNSIVPVHILDWKVYYEAYLQDLERQKKYCTRVKVLEAIETVAANYDIGKRQLYRIIEFMEGA